MSRNEFLTGIRQHKIIQTLFPPQPESPDLPEDFGRALTLMGGVWDDTFLRTSQNGYTTLNAYLRGLYPADSQFCSATPEIIAEVDFNARTQAASLKDVDVGVVRACFGVAETGAVFLSDPQLCVNSLSALAKHLVVLLDVKHIIEHLHLAHRQPQPFNARYTVMVTGPAAMADSESALMLGAKGVQNLRVIAI
ncbi:LutC/YkgG family protein [Rahnella ecdela]|jgi:L-lactate dehydrogenase complex protein LldG|uniref:LUD domain-containing protein n=1 Tax=Rahnella ecdela TaxID=2816250 RepID=A0ABS6LC67_9GAMM|nr:LUD domain-containing protein [Rahnella ecdela]MBU9844377.1 LUD domain-containing protein [Rahnella ecdela]